MTIQHILYKSIRPDPKWKYRLGNEDPVLAKSLKLKGVLSPLVLLQDKNDFVILDGFKRHWFLRDNPALKVPAFLYSIQEAKEGFLHGLVLNETRRSLSAVEKSSVVKIVQSFNDEEEFKKQVYGFLDIPPQRQFTQKYLAINAFPLEAKQYFHEFQFSLRQIERVTPVSIQSLLPWIQLAHELNIKGQEFVQLVEIIWDISIKENSAIDEQYEKLGIGEFLKQNLTTQQKVDSLKNFLHQKHYPLLNRIQEKIAEQVAHIQNKSKLPVGISWDKKLERSGYWLSIHLDNQNSIEDLRILLSSAELSDDLRKLFNIIINGLENSNETT